MTPDAPRLLDLPATLRWLDRPPLGAGNGLRGHVVVLLLWRLGCVHSRHALADLLHVQREFVGRAVVVLAVHTPIAAAERDEARLRRALARLAGPLTVGVDAEQSLRQAFAAPALPLLVLADVDGTVAFHGHGEPFRVKLFGAIETLLQRAEGRGSTARVPFVPCAVAGAPGLQPTAVAVDGDGLWVASAGHRRVFRIDRDGRVLRTIGSGMPGAADGGPANARFHEPTGLLVRGGHVIVADAGVHVLRAIDRSTGAVATWCGNGRRSMDRLGGGFGSQQGMSSPAALAGHDGGVYFAQAGAHQIWQFDADTQSASAWLGTGARSLRDGGQEATFAEPLGLAIAGEAMYVADAGNGALRHVDLGHNFARTVAQGLDRPAAVAVRPDEVLVAASWQPAVLRVGEGEQPRVWVDASDGLVEPVGLAVDGDEVWIADAGAGCLFVGDPAQRSLRRVELQDLPPVPAPAPDAAFAVLAAPLRVPGSTDVTLRIELPCGADEVVDTSAPCDVDLVDEALPVLACDRHATAGFEGGRAVVLAPVGEPGSGALRVRVQATVRRGPEAVPRQRTWRYVVPLDVGPGGDVDAVVRPAGAPA